MLSKTCYFYRIFAEFNSWQEKKLSEQLACSKNAELAPAWKKIRVVIRLNFHLKRIKNERRFKIHRDTAENS